MWWKCDFNGVDAQLEQSGSLVQKRQFARYKDDHNKHHFHLTACSLSKKQAAYNTNPLWLESIFCPTHFIKEKGEEATDIYLI